MATPHTLKLTHRFAILVGVFALGFTLYGVWSFKTLDELRVNGPLYQRIVQGKDLIADILPPPEYIIESYLVCLQLQGAAAAEREGLAGRLAALRGEYETRHAHWLQEPLEPELKELFLHQAHAPAVDFYALAFDDYLPALQRNDSDAARAALGRLQALYETHRQAIDQVVRLTTARNAADETQAQGRIDSATVLLFAILLLSLGAAVAVAVAIVRNLSAHLGGEPEYAAGIARAVAAFDLTRTICTAPGDERSLLASMRSMQGSLAEMIGRVDESVAQLAGSAARLAEIAGGAAQEEAARQGLGYSIAAAAQELSSTVAEIGSTMEELSASSTQIADHSAAVVGIARLTWENSRLGAEAMQQVQSRMEGIRADNTRSLGEIAALEGLTQGISEVKGMIQAIADQSRLIAFNAELEAASAGEAGRRFRVVAQEIRRLADGVTQSTGEIEARVGGIQGGIERLVHSAGNASAAIDAGLEDTAATAGRLAELVEAARNTTNAAQQISLSTQQQRIASEQVTVALREIVSASDHASRSIQTITEIGGDLNRMAANLKALVGQFRLGGGEGA